MKKVTIFVLAVIAFLGGALYSCNGFEDQDVELQSTELTEEAQQLKELYQVEMLKISELRESRSASEMTEEDIKTFFATFAEPTVRMMKSYGFTDKDWKEFDSTSNPAFIVSGMLFLAVLDNSTNSQSFPLLKSRAIEESNDSCVAWEQLKPCLSISALGTTALEILEKEFFSLKCITKNIFWTVVKKAALSVTVLSILLEFGEAIAECAGWI